MKGTFKHFEHFRTVSLFPCDALRDLAPFAQFKKREKHPWRKVTFRKVAGKHSSMDVFHVFKIVPTLPNCAKHHNLLFPDLPLLSLVYEKNKQSK